MRYGLSPRLVPLLLVALTGCTALRTNYVAPDILKAELAEYVPDPDAPAPDEWWRAFNDPQLDSLLAKVLNGNLDLQAEALRTAAADLETRLAAIKLRVSAGYRYDSAELFHGTPAVGSHGVALTASYEADLWGRIGAVKDQARWNAAAARLDQDNTVALVAARAVDTYFQIAALNERIEISAASTAHAQRTLELVNVLVSAGSATALERAEAVQNVERQRAAHAQLLQLLQEARNVRALLLGDGTTTASEELVRLPRVDPPAVRAGLPAGLLERRADLRAAEARLRATLAGVDVVRLGFYPPLELTTSVGAASAQLTDLLRNPPGAAAALLSAPFMQINEARFGTALARTQYQEASVLFRKRLLQALYEVEDALSRRDRLAEQMARLQDTLRAAETAERLYEVRYRAGTSPLRFWLDAQESRRQTQLAVIAVRLEQLENYSALCVALGGRAQ